MGCFSFICKESALPVASDSFSGDAVRLFLLKDGKVIEEMHGAYDSYGRVFGMKKDPKDSSHTDVTSLEWDLDWGLVCDLMFSSNEGDGIAAVLDAHSKGNIPTTRSEGDPDQGWGKKNGGGLTVDSPYHKVYRDGKTLIRRNNDDELKEMTAAEEAAPAALENTKKYYRTVIELEVLSEEPINDMSIGDIQHEINEGSLSGLHKTKVQDEELTGKAMADALLDQGSDPEFFGMDEDGELC